MTGNSRPASDLRDIVYVVYDTDPNLNDEIEMMRQTVGVTVRVAENHEDLIKAVQLRSGITIVSSHGYQSEDYSVWGLTRADKVTPVMRPADLFERAGEIGADNLIFVACDTCWSRDDSEARTRAVQEWDATDQRGARVFITQGTIRYSASRGFVKRLLKLVAEDPTGDLADLVLAARKQAGRTLEPGVGRVRIVEHAPAESSRS